MKCPRDGTELSRVVSHAIELDKCHRCDGIWFDRGELEQIRDAKLTGVEKEIEAEYGNPTVIRGETSGYMRCPRCEGRLQEVQYTVHRQVRIDRCESCLGIWLDVGELTAIVGEKKTLDESVATGRVTSLLRSLSRLLGQEN